MLRSEIHPQLLDDCHWLGSLKFCELLLHKNALVPWFILVPQTRARDFFDLGVSECDSVMGEAAALAVFVKNHFAVPKINFAAIGNIVPQLHIHVVGRRPGDACWPLPVWGHLSQTGAYSADDLKAIGNALIRSVGLSPGS